MRAVNWICRGPAPSADCRACERPESGNPHRQSLRRSEIRMVEQIGDLHSQLSANGLLDGNALDEGHRYRLSAWPNDIARREFPKRPMALGGLTKAAGLIHWPIDCPAYGLTPGNRVRPAAGRVERVEAATTRIVERTDRHEGPL